MCPEEKDKILVGESKLSETPKKPQYPVTKTKFVYDDVGNSQHEINKKLWEAFQNQIVTSGTTTIGSDGYWYVDGVKTDIKAIGVPGKDGKDGKDGAAGADGKDGVDGKDGIDGIDGKNGRDADIWTIGADDFWYVNGRKTIFKSRGEDGKSPLLRISTDGQSLEISSDGGQTWLPFEKNFNKLRVLGYVSSVQLLPRSANIGDIYGVWNPDVYSGRVDEEGQLIQGAYDLYVNTVRDWVDDYHITKVYDYDTELPSSAANGTTVLVPVDYLTLDKTKIDGYKVYRFSLDKNGWVLILDTAEIYASKEDIINHGDNVYALVQGDEEHTYELYRRDVGWVYFGTNASITYVLVQDVNEGTETNILSGKAVKDAYGYYVESPEFIRAYLDNEGKILWGIKTDGTVYFGAGVPPQVKDYIEERIGNYDDVITFLDDLEEGDETLRELLNKKVDKEEGKSLIDAEYAEGIHYIENPEFVEVKLDQDERILEAIMLDGTKLLPAGYEVSGNVVKTVSNPEYLAAWLDGDNHILFALKADGDVIFGCEVPSQIKEYANKLVEMFHYEDNPEFIDVKLDSEGKILEGIKTNGTKYLGSLDIDGITYSVVSNPEWLKAIVDSENKIICGIKTDGTFYVVDIDFLDSSNKIKEVLNHFDVKDNLEFLSVELDEDEKVLGGRKTDGTKFENVGLDLGGAVLKGMDDPEGRMEVKTDSEQKIISYRKEDGTLVENVGIETNHLELTSQGMTDFQQALKDAGFQPGSVGDWSDYISNDGDNPLCIEKPRCAKLNIISDFNLSNLSKTDIGGISGVNCELPTLVEFYDMQGNYFKKWTSMSAQGNSSMDFIKKNIAFDFFDSEFDGDAFSVKFGDWVPQDSFHLKAFYTDFFKGVSVMAYKIADAIESTRPFYENRPWKKALLNDRVITADNFTSTQVSDISLNVDTGARCMPDGFPVIVYQNGDFYGIYAWCIKKHRDNYHMDKAIPEHIHLDGDLYSPYMWNGKENIDWTKFEIRNPKPKKKKDGWDLLTIGGSKYDGDYPTEIMGEDTPGYDPTNISHVNTAKVKKYIQDFADRYPEMQNAGSEQARKELLETYFDVNNLIDYQIVNSVVRDTDAFAKNWQWITYDGIKWFVCEYDKDQAFGGHFRGMFTTEVPTAGFQSSNYVMGYINSYYESALKDRWIELTEKGVLSVDFFKSIAKSWIDAIGVDFYKKEYKKWNQSPCFRDNKLNSEYWVCYQAEDNYTDPSGDYDDNRNYAVGDTATLKYNFVMFHYRCIKPCTGQNPILGTYSLYPVAMGYYDSVWRLYSYIEENFNRQDSFFKNL